MQLNEILEENTVNAISERTNIPEKYITAMIEEDFSKINRVKTIGFISIIEREYKADLSALKELALEYYKHHNEKDSITLGLPMEEEKKGRSKWFLFIVLMLIVYAIWFAFTHLDKEKLSEMLPFSEDTLSKMIMPGNDSSTKDDSSIENNTHK